MDEKHEVELLHVLWMSLGGRCEVTLLVVELTEHRKVMKHEVELVEAREMMHVMERLAAVHLKHGVQQLWEVKVNMVVGLAKVVEKKHLKTP